MIDAEKISKTAILTSNEVMGLLGVSRPTLLKLRRSGSLKVYFSKLNGRPFYKGVDVIKFINTNVI